MKLKIKIKISSQNSPLSISEQLERMRDNFVILTHSKVIRDKNEFIKFNVWLTEKQYQKFLIMPLENRDISQFGGIVYELKSFKVIIKQETKE